MPSPEAGSGLDFPDTGIEAEARVRYSSMRRAELENAIQTIEDEITRARTQRDRGSVRPTPVGARQAEIHHRETLAGIWAR